MSVYGYIRVSSKDQNEDRQLLAMHSMDIPKRNIYLDKQSGKDFERPMYKKMVSRLKKDDLVYIKSIDLLGTFLSDIVLQLLSCVAENERETIRSRQREGIEAAKAKGVKFGRPALPMPDNYEEICKEWRSGGITTAQAAELCGVSRSTFYTRTREWRCKH